jgi:tRNA nucleotidyltransferase (CCA-adding enzyme)
LRYVSRWLNYLDPDNKLDHWLIRLAVLIASFHDLKTNNQEQINNKIAENLQLPKPIIDSLKNLDQSQKKIDQALSNHPKNSEIVQALRTHKTVTLILVTVRSEKPIRFYIWKYLTQLSQIHAPLNGNDLKEMGYKPGPQFKQILDALLAATLDGEIRDRSGAELFLQRVESYNKF